jgi:hypothetical protein
VLHALGAVVVSDDYPEGSDPWPSPSEAEHLARQRAEATREAYDRGYVSRALPLGGGGVSWGAFGGGGGGGGGTVRAVYGGGGGGGSVFVPDLSQLESNRKPTEEERAEMSWTNPEAATLAREILTQEKMDALRDRVTEEVAQYRVLLAGANCGSVFSFKKTHPEDASKHYWYAAIKSGDAWYTTARDKRVIESDEALIDVSIETVRDVGVEPVDD